MSVGDWNCRLDPACTCLTETQAFTCSMRWGSRRSEPAPDPAIGSVQVAPEFVTLRDQFAMAALTGLTVRMDLENYSAPYAAGVAYKFADAMMEARK